jgi:hypothetical protein
MILMDEMYRIFLAKKEREATLAATHEDWVNSLTQYEFLDYLDDALEEIWKEIGLIE